MESLAKSVSAPDSVCSLGAVFGLPEIVSSSVLEGVAEDSDESSFIEFSSDLLISLMISSDIFVAFRISNVDRCRDMGAMGAHFAHRLDIKNGYFISILEKDKASIFRRAFDVASKAFFHSGNEQNSYFSQII